MKWWLEVFCEYGNKMSTFPWFLLYMALVKNQGGSNVSAFRYPCHKSICIGVAFRWMACANLRKSKNVSTFRSLSTSWFPHVCIKRSFQSPNLKPSQDSTEAWLFCFDCQWWKIHERLNVFFGHHKKRGVCKSTTPWPHKDRYHLCEYFSQEFRNTLVPDLAYAQAVFARFCVVKSLTFEITFPKKTKPNNNTLKLLLYRTFCFKAPSASV